MVSVPKVPSNSRARFGGRGAQRELLVDGQVGSAVAQPASVPPEVDRRGSVGRTAGATRAMRSVRSMTTRSNALSSPVRAGSGIDQCSRPATGSDSRRTAASSSWAVSQTVIDQVLAPGSEPGRRRRAAAERGPAARGAACAAATAPGCTAGAGCVPAEVAGTGLVSFHSAAASCERAELWVHTNTTRTASCTVTGRRRVERPRGQRQVGAAPVGFRAVPGHHARPARARGRGGPASLMAWRAAAAARSGMPRPARARRRSPTAPGLPARHGGRRAAPSRSAPCPLTQPWLSKFRLSNSRFMADPDTSGAKRSVAGRNRFRVRP